MESLIEINNLTKQFRKQRAVDGVNLSVKKGEIYGLIGNNGAGKTTLLKLIGKLLKPTEGEVVFAPGMNVKRIGILIESPGVYGDMTAYENLRAKALLAGYKCKKSELEEILELVGLTDVRKKNVRQFSMGMKQRLGMALTLVGRPELLLLDEPVNGLDVQGMRDIRNILLRIHKEKQITMLVSSHLLDELSKVCTRLLMMKKGKIVIDESTNELFASNNFLDIEEWYLSVNEAAQ